MVCYFDPDTYPGVYNSANILAEQRWQVDVVALDLYGFKGSTFDSHVSLLRFTGGAWRQGGGMVPFLGFIRYVRRVARERGWQTVIGHDMMGFVTARLARTVPSERVAFWSQDLAEPARMSKAKRVLLLLKRRLLRDCPLTIAPSATRAAALCRMCHLPASPVVVFNSPRRDFSVPDSAACRQRLGLAPGDRVGVYAGGLGPRRLVPELIESVAYWPLGTKLLLAGYGTDAEVAAVRERIRAPDLRERILFVGHTSEPMALIAAADFGVSLFRTEPGCPTFEFRGMASNKIFECLALGKPVVVSRNDETDTFLKGHDCGVCVPDPTPVGVAAAVEQVVGSPSSLRRMQANARITHLAETHFENRFASVHRILEQRSLAWRPSENCL